MLLKEKYKLSKYNESKWILSTENKRILLLNNLTASIINCVCKFRYTILIS